MLSRNQTIELVNEAIESGEIHCDPSTEVKVGDINSESATAGKVIVADGEGGAEWGDIPNELPSISGNADKVLKVNSGATGVEWGEAGGSGFNGEYLEVAIGTQGSTPATFTDLMNALNVTGAKTFFGIKLRYVASGSLAYNEIYFEKANKKKNTLITLLKKKGIAIPKKLQGGLK